MIGKTHFASMSTTRPERFDRRSLPLLVAALASCLLPISGFGTPALAQVCGEAIVNTAYTASNQSWPAIASDPSTGDFMVVWTSNGSASTDPGQGVLGQRYASDGTALGTNFVVNQVTVRSQILPDVIFEPENEEFIAVWLSNEHGEDVFEPTYQAILRRFATDGSPIGGQVRIDEEAIPGMVTRKNDVGIADLPKGELVVAWSSDTPVATGDDSQYSVQARRLAGDGSPIGEQFQVNTTTTSSQRFHSLAADPTTGEFMVTFFDDYTDRLLGRYYDAAGMALGGEIPIDTGTFVGPASAVEADPANGGFRVVWTKRLPDFSDGDISTQRVDTAGNLVGSPMQVNAPIFVEESRPDITFEPDGDFWVTWSGESLNPGSDGVENVWARRFDSTGAAASSALRINTGMFQWTSNPEIALAPSTGNPGEHQPMIVWDGRTEPPDPVGLTDVNLAVAQSIFETGCPLLVDGFESGDAEAWSVEVP